VEARLTVKRVMTSPGNHTLEEESDKKEGVQRNIGKLDSSTSIMRKSSLAWLPEMFHECTYTQMQRATQVFWKFRGQIKVTMK